MIENYMERARIAHRAHGVCWFAIATLTACGASRSDDQATTAVTAASGASSDAGSASGVDSTADGGTSSGAGTDESGASIKLDVGGEADTTAADDGGECVAVDETADVGLQPADIIFVVDNSGSMDAEAAAVQQNMNAFSNQITAANVDAHVVLISAYPDSDAGICIAPPLGGGGCPVDDNNPPGYIHIADGIGSNNALLKLLEHHPAFTGALRPEAAKHIVVVSDDDSDLDANEFAVMLTALDPSFAGFTFHGIVAPEDPVIACFAQTSCCATSADVGQEYIDLINQTGGVFGNLCDQQFQPLFDALATQVIQGATLSCTYDIPPPPDGETFDPDEVNVEFDDGTGNPLAIGRVDSAADCGAVTDGWYYDDPDAPTQILVCPQTCDKIQGFSSATVSIAFGCATIPAG
jgi:hypothetical protein